MEYSYLLDFLFPLLRENLPLLKIIKHPAIFIQNPDNNSTFCLLRFFPSVFFLPHIIQNLPSLPALVAGIMPGIKHLTETFCCSLNGCDKWQIVTARAVLSKINQECAKNSDSFCRIPVWDRHCLDWRKRELINPNKNLRKNEEHRDVQQEPANVSPNVLFFTCFCKKNP